MSPQEVPASAARLVILTPIEPAATGNGLAMRAELFRSAPSDLEVRTVVVPVAGNIPTSGSAGAAVVAPDGARARAGARCLVADAAWRERLARVGSLPVAARVASPGLAEDVAGVVGGGGPVAVHVMRAYMAPLGAAVAERLEAAWATLDLDEDDAAFAQAAGDLEGAAAYERVLEVFGPLFDGLAAASKGEAAAMAGRHNLSVEQIPNAVRLPARSRGPTDLASRRAPSLLFVGNLTYAPNVEAAQRLVYEILPAVRRRLGRSVGVRLVGPHDGRLDTLRAADVEVAGFVPDLAPVYASADVVVVPLRSGAGTRIKLLEAFAHGVPVVASPVAAAGLDVADGRELLLADDCERAAAAVETLLKNTALATRLAGAASRLVRERYSVEAVIPMIQDFFDRAASAGRRRAQSGAP